MAATTASRRTVRATVDPFPTCGCGQALDICHTRHCPRCGRTIVHGRRVLERRAVATGVLTPEAVGVAR